MNNYPMPLISEIQKSEQYYIIFDLQDKKYAINIKNVVEIINIPSIEIPQSTPEGIIGMFNYNGTVIKAVDLCPFLGLITSPFTINNRMIIIQAQNECFCVNTENIETIAKFEQEKIQDIPYSVQNSILSKLYKTEEGIINIIDIETVCALINRENNQKSEIQYKTLFPTDEKSVQILSLRAKNNLVKQDSFSFPVNIQSEKQYILFTMDNKNYYIDIKHVKEFISIKRLNITKLPYTSSYITGIVNVKGEFLVVFDLKCFLDENNTGKINGGKLIIAEGRNFNVAFLVDDIKYIRSLKDIRKSKLYAGSHDYIYAEFMEDDKLSCILNFEKIITDDKLYINIE